MSKTNPARGMRDFLPADVRKREYVIGVIKQVYESYGFEPLETPAVENIETLMGKYGEEGNQLIFKILKRGEKLKESEELFGVKELVEYSEHPDANASAFKLTDLALRYDLTVPLARVVANRRNDLPKFFKRYQIQPVWRADRPARGRFREFYQCDVDAIGSRSILVEAELCAAISEVLLELGFKDFKIKFNHRKLLEGILFASGIERKHHEFALVSLDKIDKIDFEGVREEFETKGLPGFDKISSLYRELFQNQGYDSIVKRIADFIGLQGTEDFDSPLADTFRLFEFFDAFNLREKYDLSHDILYYDVTLARGLSYYTGIILEVVLTQQDFAGSIAGGGRYDGLIGMFGKEQIPACGFSLGLERILVVMDERGMFPPEIAESTPADVMVTLWSKETAGESLKLASELRSQGLRVTVYPEPDKFGKQMKYADTIRVPFVCVLGESEIAENNVTVKNMRTGEQITVDVGGVADSIKSNLKG